VLGSSCRYRPRGHSATSHPSNLALGTKYGHATRQAHPSHTHSLQ
jgi:hypothetical protein